MGVPPKPPPKEDSRKAPSEAPGGDDNQTNHWPHKHLAKCQACGHKGATLQCKFQKEGASAWHSLCGFCGKDNATIYCEKCKNSDLVYCSVEHMEEHAPSHHTRCVLQQHLNEAMGLFRKEQYKLAARKLHSVMKGAVDKGQRWVEAEATRSLVRRAPRVGRIFLRRATSDGHVKLQMMEREKAMHYLQQAMAISTELEDARGQAYCYMFMAQAYTPSGPKDCKGREYAEHAIAIATQEQKETEKLCAGRCDAFVRSEMARANALLSAANLAFGRVRRKE